jgi:hypothetical protein
LLSLLLLLALPLRAPSLPLFVLDPALAMNTTA